MLSLDLNSVRQLEAAVDRNRRLELRQEFVTHQIAAQGDSDSAKKYLKALESSEQKAESSKNDQRRFMSRMKGFR